MPTRKVKTNNIAFKAGTGYLNANFFQETLDSPILVKKALVAYEGTFNDSNDVPHTFSPDRLGTIAEHTNRAISTGIDIPVCTDHKKDVAHTVGNLGADASAYTKVIEQEDLPNDRATHLLGKLGLFVDNVSIKATDAIEKVKNKIVTSVSMGLSLDKNDHRLIELSLVPIPAIPNMGLFKLGMPDDNNAFSWEDLESNEETIEELREEYDQLTENLWTLLNNIYSSESIDISDLVTLQQYVYTVLNGFSVRTLDLLGLANVAPEQMPSSNTMTADGTQQMQQTQVQDVNAQATQPAMYRRGKGNVSNFNKYSKGAKYIRR